MLKYLDVPHVKWVTNRRVARESGKFQLIQELDNRWAQVHYGRSWEEGQCRYPNIIDQGPYSEHQRGP